MMKKILNLILICLIPLWSFATIVVPSKDMGTMATSSDIVVYGKIVGHVGDNTYLNKFEVIESIKGEYITKDIIYVGEYSSMNGDRFTKISGDTNYEIGKNYLLFLGRGSDGTFKANFLSLGVFEEGDYAGQQVFAHNASFLDLYLAADINTDIDGFRGVYKVKKLIPFLQEIIGGSETWSSVKAGLVVDENVKDIQQYNPSSEQKSGFGPCPNDVPAHCTTIFGCTGNDGPQSSCTGAGSQATCDANTPGRFATNSWDVCVAMSASTDPSNANNLMNLQDAVTTMNSMPGLNLTYGGVAPCAVSCASGSAADDALACNGGSGSNPNKMWVFFNDPCNQIADLSGCAGVLGIGGSFGGFTPPSCNTDICGDMWQNLDTPFFVMNNGSGCTGEYSYTATLIHEMLHAVGVGHIGGDAGDPGTGGTQCTAIMNPVVCNANAPTNPNLHPGDVGFDGAANYGITALDEACTDWMYNITTASNCSISNVTSANIMCSGDDVVLEVTFDYIDADEDGDGNSTFTVEINGGTAITTVPTINVGDSNTGNATVSATLTGPFAGGVVNIAVRNDAVFACFGEELNVTVPRCPELCASTCANAAANSCPSATYTSDIYPGSGSTSMAAGDGSGIGCNDFDGIGYNLEAGSGNSVTFCHTYTTTASSASYIPFTVAGDPTCLDQSIQIFDANTCTDATTQGITVNQPSGGTAGNATGLTRFTDYVVCLTYTENNCATDFDATLQEVCFDVVEPPTCDSDPDNPGFVIDPVCSGDDITIDFGALCTTWNQFDDPNVAGGISGYGLAVYAPGGTPTAFPIGAASDWLVGSDPDFDANVVFLATNGANGGGCNDLTLVGGFTNTTCDPIQIPIGIFNMDVNNNIVALGGDGCEIITVGVITVNPSPEQDPIVQISNCGPTIITAACGDSFTAVSGGNGSGVVNGDGTVSYTPVAGDGTATLSLTAQNEYTCTAMIITDVPEPLAGIGSGFGSVCLGETVDVTAQNQKPTPVQEMNATSGSLNSPVVYNNNTAFGFAACEGAPNNFGEVHGFGSTPVATITTTGSVPPSTSNPVQGPFVDGVDEFCIVFDTDILLEELSLALISPSGTTVSLSISTGLGGPTTTGVLPSGTALCFSETGICPTAGSVCVVPDDGNFTAFTNDSSVGDWTINSQYFDCLGANANPINNIVGMTLNYTDFYLELLACPIMAGTGTWSSTDDPGLANIDTNMGPDVTFTHPGAGMGGTYNYTVTGALDCDGCVIPDFTVSFVAIDASASNATPSIPNGTEFCSGDAATTFTFSPALTSTPGSLDIVNYVGGNGASGAPVGATQWAYAIFNGIDASGAFVAGFDPANICVSQISSTISNGNIATNLAPGDYSIVLWNLTFDGYNDASSYTIVDHCGIPIATASSTALATDCNYNFFNFTIEQEMLTVSGPGLTLSNDPDGTPNNGDEIYEFDPAAANVATAGMCNENIVNYTVTSSCGCVTEDSIALFVYEEPMPTDITKVIGDCATDGTIDITEAELAAAIGGTGPWAISYNDGQGNMTTNTAVTGIGSIIIDGVNAISPVTVTVGFDGTYTGMITDPSDGTSMIACDGNSCTATFNINFTTCIVCPMTNTSSDDTGMVCSGTGTDDLAAWQTSVTTANPLDGTQDPSNVGSIVYSSVTPIATTVAPDNILPTGIHSGADNCVSETQTVMAYVYCDADDSGTITNGDTYTLVSTYTLTVYPAIQVPIENVNMCMNTITPQCSDVLGAASNPTGDADVANWDSTTGVYTAQPADAAGTIDIAVTSGIAGSTCTGSFTITTPACPVVCPTATVIADGNGTVCTGGGTDNLTTWQSDVATANTMGLVYSSITPVAGTTTPDGILPDGGAANAIACASYNQTVMAYVYCDVDNSGGDSAGDTYTLVSTYTLTIYPLPDVTNAAGGTCSDAVIDNCGAGVTILYDDGAGGTISNTTPPSLNPGDADITVNWTAALTGAPAACQVTNNFVLNCPSTTFTITNAFGATDPCTCNGDQGVNNMVGDGTFSETVTINGPADVMVRIATETVGTTDLVLPAMATQTGAGTGAYNITFNHVDREGYDITLVEFSTDGGITWMTATDTNGDPIAISNQCAYPILDFAFDSPLCSTASPINLSTSLNTTVSGTFTPDASGTTFTVDGNAATTFDASTAGAGSHTIIGTYITDNGTGQGGTTINPAVATNASSCPITVEAQTIVTPVNCDNSSYPWDGN